MLESSHFHSEKRQFHVSVQAQTGPSSLACNLSACISAGLLPSEKMGVFTVVNTEDKGRGLVTAQDVTEGAELLSEGPLLLTVASEAVHEVCAECLRQLPEPGALAGHESQSESGGSSSRKASALV